MYCWYRSIKYSIKAIKVKASWLFTNEIQELAIMQNFRASTLGWVLLAPTQFSDFAHACI